MYLKICDLDPSKLPSATGLMQQEALKKTKVKLDLLTGIDMLLWQKKVLEEEYVTLFSNMQKLITNTKDYDKNKELPSLQYWDVNNLKG